MPVPRVLDIGTESKQERRVILFYPVQHSGSLLYGSQNGYHVMDAGLVDLPLDQPFGPRTDHEYAAALLNGWKMLKAWDKN